jgi:hypothetical protein
VLGRRCEKALELTGSNWPVLPRAVVIDFTQVTWFWSSNSLGKRTGSSKGSHGAI